MKNGILFIIGLILFSSCENVVMIDLIDPRLPAYSEEGRRKSGAIINGEVWRNLGHPSDQVPISNNPTIQHKSDTMVLTFNGYLLEKEQYLGFRFFILDSEVTNFTDLNKLANRSITFGNGINSIKLLHPFYNPDCSSVDLEGQIRINKLVPNDSNGWIMAGTFYFYQLDNCGETYLLEYGRFDYHITEYNYNVILIP